MYSIPGYDSWKLASPYDEKVTCPCCGESCIEDEMIEVDDSNEFVCPSCFDNYVECDSCHGYHHEDVMNEAGKLTLCESCFEDQYVECEKCGEAFKKEDVSEESLSVPFFYCENCAHGKKD